MFYNIIWVGIIARISIFQSVLKMTTDLCTIKNFQGFHITCSWLLRLWRLFIWSTILIYQIDTTIMQNINLIRTHHLHNVNKIEWRKSDEWFQPILVIWFYPRFDPEFQKLSTVRYSIINLTYNSGSTQQTRRNFLWSVQWKRYYQSFE